MNFNYKMEVLKFLKSQFNDLYLKLEVLIQGERAIPVLNGISNEKFVLSLGEWTKYIVPTCSK